MAEPWDIEDIEIAMPETNLRTGELTKIIDDYLIANPERTVRNYIGASSIGHPCERKIWYGYRGVQGLPVDPQTQRTFDVGHHLESMIIEYLELSGLNIVYDDLSALYFSDPEIPELQGHCDAIIDVSPEHSVIVEIKTARDSSFNVFVKSGLKKWYPIYYSQLQAYMGMSGIHEAYVLAINKDTSKLHDEHVIFDPIHYEEIRLKALRIIETEEPPAKINNNPCFFTCRMCNYRELCHG